ncbi:MAG: hypothetical protein SGARI_005456 [Bacillariaceae sp.]
MADLQGLWYMLKCAKMVCDVFAGVSDGDLETKTTADFAMKMLPILQMDEEEQALQQVEGHPFYNKVITAITLQERGCIAALPFIDSEGIEVCSCPSCYGVLPVGEPEGVNLGFPLKSKLGTLIWNPYCTRLLLGTDIEKIHCQAVPPRAKLSISTDNSAAEVHLSKEKRAYRQAIKRLKMTANEDDKKDIATYCDNISEVVIDWKHDTMLCGLDAFILDKALDDPSFKEIQAEGRNVSAHIPDPETMVRRSVLADMIW